MAYEQEPNVHCSICFEHIFVLIGVGEVSSQYNCMPHDHKTLCYSALLYSIQNV